MRLPQLRSILRAAQVSNWVPLVLLAVTATLLLVSTSCVTAIPRPGGPTLEATSPVPAPTAEPTPVVLTPTPTSRLESTATTAPSPRPTVEPGPLNPTPITAATPPPTADPNRLMLQVYAPEEGATVPGSWVAVYGLTSPGNRIFISGEETEVDSQGGFRAEISLDPSENEVVILAQDDAGRMRRITRTVTSLALPFLLLVTEPQNESIVSVPALPLSGRTGPNAILSINGRSVPVDRFGYFSSSVRLDEGPNIIDVVATNDDGRTLSTVLAVIYRAPRN